MKIRDGFKKIGKILKDEIRQINNNERVRYYVYRYKYKAIAVFIAILPFIIFDYITIFTFICDFIAECFVVGLWIAFIIIFWMQKRS